MWWKENFTEIFDSSLSGIWWHMLGNKGDYTTQEGHHPALPPMSVNWTLVAKRTGLLHLKNRCDAAFLEMRCTNVTTKCCNGVVELCPQSITPRQSYETFEYNLPIQN
jgi:hypothetical protein